MNGIRVDHVFLQNLDVAIPIYGHILRQEVESIPPHIPTEATRDHYGSTVLQF